MTKIKTLLLLHELSLTGAPRVAMDAFGELRDALDTRIVSFKGGPLADRFRAIGPIVILDEIPVGSDFSLRIRRRIQRVLWRREILRWAPDLIYVNTMAALRVATRLDLPRAPVLLHVHEMGLGLAEFWNAWPDTARRWPDRYITVSGPAREDLLGYGVAPDRVSLIHEFVQTREPGFALSRSGPETHPAAGTGKKPLIVGGAGSIAWRKGPVLWLQVAAEVQRLVGDSRVRFRWVGVPDGMTGAEFKETARKLNVGALVDAIPVTPDPISQFSAFDLFALTSMEDPCPLVVLESMMLGTPVICFAGSGGAPEEVGDTGVVVEEFSPALMARAIVDLAEAPGRRLALGQAARERVLRHFSAETRAPLILSEMRRTIREAKRSARPAASIRELR